MKKLQRFTIAVVLTLALSASAFAGDIWLGKAPPPPPEPPSATAPGIIHTGIQTPSEQQNSAAPSEAFAEIALNLLQSLLSVF